MAIEAGQHVRHRSRLEWGVGKVEGTNGESVFVRFGDQLKTIKIAFAEQFLEPVSAEELAASKPVERAGPAVGRIAQCPECGKALVRGSNGEWRSCPNCLGV
jgi:transcription elongation factor GreA-like protein